MDLTNLLQGQLSDGLLDVLSQQLGGADKEKTSKAASGAISTIIGALAKNASTPDGASALNNALEKDHDGGVLDNIMDLLGPGESPSGFDRAMNGAGILKHVLGDRQSGATDMISQMSGLNSTQSGNLMGMLAPIVMGALGRQKKNDGLDIGGLASLLTGAVTSNKTSNPMLALATRFLDKDGDGSIMDEAAGFGMKILGGLFGKK